MGMYDYVDFEMPCPVCNNKLSGFQSKDSVCLCEIISVDMVNRFYTKCMKCSTWVEFTRKPKDKPTPSFEEVCKEFDMHIEEAKEAQG